MKIRFSNLLNYYAFTIACSCLLLFSSCLNESETISLSNESLSIGGPVDNSAVLNNDTVFTGGWDTSIKAIGMIGDSVAFDCSRFFHGIYWRWCGDSLFELDTNIVLYEVNRKISFFDSSFWCLNSFSLLTERTDSSLILNSQFNRGDTTFYQTSYWSDKKYWPID